eukprot:m.335861 g.335861  ORF g.335861 m.335861 type:complete len:61 (-) comp17696_c0_seq1:121-303(-)
MNFWDDFKQLLGTQGIFSDNTVTFFYKSFFSNFVDFLQKEDFDFVLNDNTGSSFFRHGDE